MSAPDLCGYMCLTQALVVRKAPSRWMASIFFQSAKGKSSIGCTIWMPALETRMSIRAEGLDRLLDACVDLVLLGDVHADADRRFLSPSPLRGLRRDIGFQDRRSTTRPPASTKRLAMP